VTSVRLRSATGIFASAALGFGVLAAIASDAGQAHPGLATGADSPASTASSAASPAAAVAPEPTGSDLSTPGTSTDGSLGPAPDHLVVPDLVATIPGGFSAYQLAEIAGLSGVRAVMPVDGGQVRIDGAPASLLGVSPQAFRSWAPPNTADTTGVWTALASGDLIASQASEGRLALTLGTLAHLTGATAAPMVVAAAVPLGLPGVDGLVDVQRAGQLGLVANVAVLINAPGANLAALMRQVLSVTGPTGQVVNLVPIQTTEQLPVVTNVPAGVPTTYLTLDQESAAEYCPGLSWTVLAAIAQIESGQGANDGPSSAGALGPMQFLPSTWAAWGIDAFGQTGTPDIMNPLDAVPSAARMLCADGAAAGGASLEAAIYDYNHADWYVSEVLTLAHEYAEEYA
jgi:transglycosylase-like protein with SLT domain